MKEIKLAHGKVTLVDDKDFEWLNQWTWTAHYCKHSGLTYVMRNERDKETKKVTRITMHREITNAPEDMYVDHINHDTLDNQRSNIRLATSAQNSYNVRMKRSNSTGYKGIDRLPSKNWRARIRFSGTRLTVGIFSKKEDAARAYNEAAIKYHGEFACLNKI